MLIITLLTTLLTTQQHTTQHNTTPYSTTHTAPLHTAPHLTAPPHTAPPIQRHASLCVRGYALLLLPLYITALSLFSGVALMTEWVRMSVCVTPRQKRFLDHQDKSNSEAYRMFVNGWMQAGKPPDGREIRKERLEKEISELEEDIKKRRNESRSGRNSWNG